MRAIKGADREVRNRAWSRRVSADGSFHFPIGPQRQTNELTGELARLRQELAETKQLLADKVLELNRLKSKVWRQLRKILGDPLSAHC